MQIVAQGVRDAVQSAITETCEDNYANIYNGIREGYSGGYKRNGDKWEENISAGDVYSRLDDKLRTHEEGGCHVKYSGETVEYRLSGLTAQITNAPFAPKNTEEKNQLTCSAEIDLEVPLSFGWQFLPPMKIHLPIKGGYTPKF
ncbi:MAG TPA: hypothetical protein VHP31_09230 [Caproicibacter sp.]|nr:hypothetical protein [Caproicibacter sp.]